MQEYIKGKKLEEQILTLGVSMQGDTSPVQVELVDVKIVKCINGLDTRRAKRKGHKNTAESQQRHGVFE